MSGINLTDAVNSVAANAIAEIGMSREQRQAVALSYEAVGNIMKAKADSATADAGVDTASALKDIFNEMDEAEARNDAFRALCFKTLAGRVAGVEAPKERRPQLPRRQQQSAQPAQIQQAPAKSE